MVDIVDKLLDITKDMDAELAECKEKMLRLEERAALDAAEVKYLKHTVVRRDQAIVDLKDKVHVEASGHARYVALGKELKRIMPDKDRHALKGPVDKRAEEVIEKLQVGFDELYASHVSGDKSAEREHKEKLRKVAEAFKKKRAPHAKGAATRSPIHKQGGKGAIPRPVAKPKRQGLRSPQNRHMSAVTAEWNKIKAAAKEKGESHISLFNYAKERWAALPAEGKQVYIDAFVAEKAARDAARVASGEYTPKKVASQKSNGQKPPPCDPNHPWKAGAIKKADSAANDNGNTDADEDDADDVAVGGDAEGGDAEAGEEEGNEGEECEEGEEAQTGGATAAAAATAAADDDDDDDVDGDDSDSDADA